MSHLRRTELPTKPLFKPKYFWTLRLTLFYDSKTQYRDYDEMIHTDIPHARNFFMAKKLERFHNEEKFSVAPL
jgi:hypothetical protein